MKWFFFVEAGTKNDSVPGPTANVNNLKGPIPSLETFRLDGESYTGMSQIKACFIPEVTIAWHWVTWCCIWGLGSGYAEDPVQGSHRVEATEKARHLEPSCTHSHLFPINKLEQRLWGLKRRKGQKAGTAPPVTGEPPSLPWLPSTSPSAQGLESPYDQYATGPAGLVPCAGRWLLGC